MRESEERKALVYQLKNELERAKTFAFRLPLHQTLLSVPIHTREDNAHNIENVWEAKLVPGTLDCSRSNRGSSGTKASMGNIHLLT